MQEIPYKLYTVRQFIDKQKGTWPSEKSLRLIIFQASRGKNNFSNAFKRIGKRVLVNEYEFWKCVNESGEKFDAT